MNKEQTPAAPNSAEAAKQEKDGLLVLGDLAAYAAAGFAAIPPAGLERLKWYGLYVQRPREEGRFMLRIKLPGGEVRADQAAAVAEVAARYGRGLVDITTRQDLELHWLEIGDVPAVLAALGAAGLTTRQAAGDCPRNIVASPLAGVDPEEVLDVRPLVASLNAFFDGNRQFSNLPRKFKISLSGHPAYTAQGEINDLSFAPAVKTLAGRKVKGFHVRVGGGLSAQPRLARSLDLFVRPEEVVRLAAGVAAIFRDHGYREKRNHCRLKFLLDDWGAARFEEELRRRTGLRETRGDDVAPGAVRPGWFGWHAQKQPGRAWLGLSVPAGRLTARELQELARLAAACGDGTLRATSDQNLVLLNLEDARREDVLKEAVLLRLTPFPASVTGPAVTCIGRELCPFAVVETKAQVPQLLAAVQKRVHGQVPVRVHVSGCPNSCGQPQLGDIGLQGVFVKVGEHVAEGFEVLLGGRPGPEAAFAQRLAGRVTAAQTEEVLVDFITFFEGERREGETFSEFVRRQGLEAFQERLNAQLPN